jgi:hypothetical protein
MKQWLKTGPALCLKIGMKRDIMLLFEVKYVMITIDRFKQDRHYSSIHTTHFKQMTKIMHYIPFQCID